MMPLFAEFTPEKIGMGLLATAIFGAVGIVFLMLSFKIFEWITPKLDVEQKLQDGNIAVSVVVGALLIAVAIVMAAAISG